MKLIYLFLFGTLNIFAQNLNNSNIKKDTINGIFAEIETSKGLIIAQLDYKTAPVTVANFITLAEGTNKFIKDEKLIGKPFYDGLKFHIVIKDYMIKSGDPTGLGEGGTGYTVKGEYTREMIFEKGGELAMDNSEVTRNFSSQFFITHRKTEWYSGEKTIFGHVITDIEIVKDIEQNDIIKKITIKKIGAEAESFDAVKIFDEYFTIKKPIEEKEEANRQLEIENKKAEAKAQQDKAKAELRLFSEKNEKIAKSDKFNYFNETKTKATKTPSGLKYVIIKKGLGKKPVSGQQIYIYFSQYREDGSLDATNCEDVAKLYGRYNNRIQSTKGYDPFPYEIGQKDAMLPGIVEGMNKMNIGDKYLLFIPSTLAYGTQGSGDIKPNTNLIFEIEILKSIPIK